mgnify:CR=1 FL=1
MLSWGGLMSGDNDDKKKGDDFTSILDLGEYEHQESTEINRKLQKKNEEEKREEEQASLDLPPDLPEEMAQEEPEEAPEENFFTETAEEEFPVSSFEDAPEDNQWPSFETSQEDTDADADADAEEIPPEDTQEQLDESLEETPFDFTNDDDHGDLEKKFEENFEEKIEDTPKEDFQEVKDYAENLSPPPNPLPPPPLSPPSQPSPVQNISFNIAGGTANPPFSLLAQYIQEEDVEDIMTILREFGVAKADNEEVLTSTMKHAGSLLVSQITEYVVIHLALRLRRFSLDLKAGHSDEIYPPKGKYENPRGNITSPLFPINQKETGDFSEREKMKPEEVAITTLNHLEERKIAKYISIFNQHYLVNKDEVEKGEIQHYFDRYGNEARSEVIKKKGNALIGLQYQIMPLGHEYQLTFTGSIVWAV